MFNIIDARCNHEEDQFTFKRINWILGCVIPVVLSNNKNKLNGTYVYRHKHNYISYSTFTISKVQLHVSAINVGHLQVVHEALNDKLYLHVSGGTVCGVRWVRDLVLCL